MKNYVLIGDIHSQYHQLFNALEFIQNNIPNFYLIFLGDIFDSRVEHSNSLGVYEILKQLQENNKCIILQSNHQEKFIRYLKGNPVTINNGLDKTINDLGSNSEFNSSLLDWLSTFPYGVAFKDLHGQEYRCSHAYFSSKFYVPLEYENEYLINFVSKHTKSKCIYGPIHDNVRIHWWNEPSTHNWVRVSGHYHYVHIDLEITKSIILDGECGSEGGKLYIYDTNNRKPYYF